MNVSVVFQEKMPLTGLNPKGHATLFDTSAAHHGSESAPSPMEVVLESLASCSMMDIIGILKKQRKDIVTLRADIDADRASEHPKVFTAIRIVYRLSSPDCSVSELEKAIGLSIDRYCSVSAMLKRSGCSISWKAELSDSNSKP